MFIFANTRRLDLSSIKASSYAEFNSKLTESQAALKSHISPSTCLENHRIRSVCFFIWSTHWCYTVTATEIFLPTNKYFIYVFYGLINAQIRLLLFVFFTNMTHLYMWMNFFLNLQECTLHTVRGD